MIIFAGDWVRINDIWYQVADVNGNDQVLVSGNYDPVWVTANEENIQQVRSNPEMQQLLSTVE